MFVLLVVFALIFFFVLLLVAGVRPSQSSMSYFELDRRAKKGDSEAQWHLNREKYLGDIISLQRVLSAILLLITAWFAIGAFGWWLGGILALAIAIFYERLARAQWMAHESAKLYEKHEKQLLQFVKKYPGLFGIWRSVKLDTVDYHRIDSREELEDLVSRSEGVLSDQEKKLISSSLKFSGRHIVDIMTPKSVIDAVKDSEFLGPLVLAELHKLGHSRLPVYHESMDHVVGVLYIQDLLTLGSKKSVTAEKAMEPKVFYIREDQTLEHALAAFIKSRHHLFIVVNEFRETTGLITLEDVIEALLGHKIVDEFDVHDDLRVAAEGNVRHINEPPHREDV